jgi:hypothetical protein
MANQRISTRALKLAKLWLTYKTFDTNQRFLDAMFRAHQSVLGISGPIHVLLIIELLLPCFV